jgi:hypothetical protein
MGRVYYKTTISPKEFIYLTAYKLTGKFVDFGTEFNVVLELQSIDASFEVFKYWNDDNNQVWVWDMDEDWRHKLIDNLVCGIDIDYIEEMIADIGFRKCCKIADDIGFCEDMTLEDLSTDMGMRKLFYCVLCEHLDCVADLDGDGYTQIKEQEWEALKEINDGDDYRDTESHNSWSEHGESEDEDEDEIVPITDEALDRIGGKVAICA